MVTIQSTGEITADELPAVRKITTEDLNWALAEGWRDFADKRGDLMFAGILYPIIGFAAATFAMNTKLLPLFFPMVAGISILGPAVASGFYELARRRELGLESDWSHFLDPLKGRSRTPLLMLTAMLVGLFALWMAVAWAIFQSTIATEFPMRAEDFLAATFGTPQGWTMIILGNIAGFVFAVLTLWITVVSFPMVVDKPVEAHVALATSLAAVRANPGPITGWGIRIAALLFLGSLPFFIGLAVVLPWVGYATWHLYTRLVER